jgi:pimeloyl-ACP methyl ester carboxylesterase
MRSIIRAADTNAMAPMRMVWLPGAYQTAQDFLDAGFADAVQRRGIPLDLAFVDLELQHLGDRAALHRLHSEQMLAAREKGVLVWLAGISLGGLIALDYAATYPGDCDGLCLFAPYLGNRMLTAEIAAAPGVAAWEPGELAEGDEERRIWGFIKTREKAPPLYLGFGRDDRFAPAHVLLASVLPADSVNVIAGGHDWRTWSTLWENFLDLQFP